MGLTVARWTVRGLSLIIIGFFVTLFLGEGGFRSLSGLTINTAILFLFFPVGLTIGMLVGWFRERLGGIISIGSLILFYIAHYIFDHTVPTGTAFFILALPGFLFILISMAKKP